MSEKQGVDVLERMARFGWTRAVAEGRCTVDGVPVAQSDQTYKNDCRTYAGRDKVNGNVATRHTVVFGSGSHGGSPYRIYAHQPSGAMLQIVQYDGSTVVYDKSGTVSANRYSLRRVSLRPPAQPSE